MLKPINNMDRMYLNGFNADFESEAFQEEYSQLRTVWERANNRGGMDIAVLLMLCAKHQRPLPKPDNVPEEVVPPPSVNSKPKGKKELQAA